MPRIGGTERRSVGYGGGRWLRAAVAILALAVCGGAFTPALAQNIAQKSTISGLPLPRFASLKSDRVNMRTGPGTEYPTTWVFRRAGLPVEILEEVEAWRQIRDAEGATGWVAQSLLSGRRTALVLPWEVKAGQSPPLVELRADDSETASVLAAIEAGVIANVRSCDGRWCLVAIGEYRGYIEQAKLWGVYKGEVIR
ncbi:MAG TPA: SH3 domain-containing protein [Hyphomicrobiaceae bacterium]|nr:SH3 domain-containing protein [Hyphomicrobiaceae bacterium]